MALPLVIAGLITKIGTTRDKSFVITVETQDKDTLQDSQKAQILNLLDEYATVAFKPTEEGKTDPELLDVPDIKPEFKDDKSPSQRLRAVLYVLLEQTLKRKPTPEEREMHYRRQVEKFIDLVKSKLN
jgi:hypothetical protein